MGAGTSSDKRVTARGSQSDAAAAEEEEDDCGCLKHPWSSCFGVACEGCFAYRCCPTACFGRGYYYKRHGLAKDYKPSCWPCAAHGVYMHLPSSDESLKEDAVRLHDSMSGVGTHDSELIRILTQRTPEQMKDIKRHFLKLYGAKHKGKKADKEGIVPGSLEDWIRDDTSGDFRRLLMALVRDGGVRDAKRLHRAMKGTGTDDNELRELLTTRANAHVLEAAEAYDELYGKPLIEVIQGETSFNYEKTLVALVDKAQWIAVRLHEAIAHWGTDDSRVIRILSSVPRSNKRMRRLLNDNPDMLNLGLNEDLEDEFSMPDLQDVKKAYQLKYDKSLAVAIGEDTSGNFKRLALALLEDPDDSVAGHFNEAFNFEAGTNDEMIIELVSTHSNSALQECKVHFERLFGHSFVSALEGETSGDFRKTLLGLVSPRAEQVATTLRQAMEDVGTQDERLVTALAGRSRHDIKEIARAYRRKYQRDLEQDLMGETSLWYRRGLRYMIRQANEDVYYLSPQRLLRIQDM